MANRSLRVKQNSRKYRRTDGRARGVSEGSVLVRYWKVGLGRSEKRDVFLGLTEGEGKAPADRDYRAQIRLC